MPGVSASAAFVALRPAGLDALGSGNPSGETSDRGPGLGSAGTDEGNGCEQGVAPVVVVPVGDLVEQIGVESSSESGTAHHGEADLAVLLAPEVNLGQVLGQQGLVRDGVGPADASNLQGVSGEVTAQPVGSQAGPV